MTLVDTSSWIESLRPGGDQEVTGRVRALLAAGSAAWCPVVRLELWNGARGEHEKRVLREMERQLVELAIPPAVWAQAFDLARKSRAAGETVPPVDILIAACATHHGVGLEHCDAHFDVLKRFC